MELKKGYKETEVGAIPNDWGVHNIAVNSTMKARIGWQGLTTAEYLSMGDYYLVTGTDFFDGRIKWETCHFVTKDRFDQDRNIQVKQNDILITKDGTIGKVAFIDELPLDATLNSGVFVVRPIDNAYDPKYCYYVFKSQYFDSFLRKLVAGSTINHLYQKDFVSFQFPLPPTKAEQTAIATTLSDMDNLIAGMEQLIAKKKAIKQGAMQELLRPKEGWVVKKLGDVASKITVGFVGSMSYLFLESGIPVLRGLNILPGKIDLSVLKYISTSTHKEWSKSALREGDVVLVRVGYPGTAAVVPKGFPEANAASLVIVSPNEKLLCSEFLSIYLNSNFGVNQIQEKLVGGAQQVFNIGTAADLEIPIPRLIDEQMNISDCINAFDDEIDLLTINLSKYKLLKQGMMQELLTGRTRVL
jgi:type I restriction enzyme S subunit